MKKLLTTTAIILLSLAGLAQTPHSDTTRLDTIGTIRYADYVRLKQLLTTKPESDAKALLLRLDIAALERKFSWEVRSKPVPPSQKQ